MNEKLIQINKKIYGNFNTCLKLPVISKKAMVATSKGVRCYKILLFAISEKKLFNSDLFYYKI